MAALPAEQQAIAAQLLKGGVPAVRQAIEEQNQRARAAGDPEIGAEALLALAGELQPRLRAAEWRDRAEAAAKIVDTVGLRDLRAIVAAAHDNARDETARALSSELSAALERRTAEERQAWLDDIVRSLDEGRVVRALRTSARPLDPGTKFPDELLGRLSDAAARALAPDAMPERWVAVLEAVVSSPVRRSVEPAGLPPDPPPALMSAARAAASRVPALVGLLGLDRAPIPPPPGRRSPPPRRPSEPVSVSDASHH